MAKRTNAGDLTKLIENGAALAVIDAEAVTGGVQDKCTWYRISTQYKTERSANASASIFRRKLGAGYRVKSIGQFVYMIFDGLPEVQGATALENAA